MDETEKLQTHRRGSGVSTVYETLRNEIIELKLPPGSPIDEQQLSDRFALSRTPIREALVRLAAEGLITRPTTARIRLPTLLSFATAQASGCSAITCSQIPNSYRSSSACMSPCPSI